MIQFLIAGKLLPVDWFLFSMLLTNLLRKALQNLVNHIKTYRRSHRMCSVRIGVLRNFIKFTEKPLCQSLFFNKVAGLRPVLHLFYRTPLGDCFWTHKKWKELERISSTDMSRRTAALKNPGKQVCIKLLLLSFFKLSVLSCNCIKFVLSCIKLLSDRI